MRRKQPSQLPETSVLARVAVTLHGKTTTLAPDSPQKCSCNHTQWLERAVVDGMGSKACGRICRIPHERLGYRTATDLTPIFGIRSLTSGTLRTRLVHLALSPAP